LVPFTLIKEQPLLRATLINVFSFAQFGAFWTTMVLLLSAEPLILTSTTMVYSESLGLPGTSSFGWEAGDKGVLELQ
jgi:hypothetical protein